MYSTRTLLAALLILRLGCVVGSGAFRIYSIHVPYNASNNSLSQLREFDPINKTQVIESLDLDDDYDLEEQEYRITDKGTRWTRLLLSFKGVPIYGSSVTFEFDPNGSPTGRGIGHAVKHLSRDLKSISPSISGNWALVQLRQLYHPRCETESIVEPAKEESRLTIAMVKGEPRLAFSVSYLVEPAENKLNASYPHAIVDAMTGDILIHWEGLNTMQVEAVLGNEGTGQDRRKVDMNHAKGMGENWCAYKNRDVEVMNMMHTEGRAFAASDIPCFAASDPSFDYDNGGFSAMNDVFYYSQKTHDIWMELLERPPLGYSWKPIKIKGRAHVLSCQPLAYWDGSYINFGDGVCDRMYPVTSADIVAHEIAHGFTQYTSGLVYSDESGAMNEAFSDMAGETVEFVIRQKKNKTNDWINAAHVFREPVSFLRNLSDPQPPSISHYDQYEPGMDVHYSSGIYNKAFYLLSTTEGWNITKAFTVMSLANAIYWEGTSTMHCGACGVELAATEFGYDQPAVLSAFERVGVMCSRCQ